MCSGFCCFALFFFSFAMALVSPSSSRACCARFAGFHCIPFRSFFLTPTPPVTPLSKSVLRQTHPMRLQTGAAASAQAVKVKYTLPPNVIVHGDIPRVAFWDAVRCCVLVALMVVGWRDWSGPPRPGGTLDRVGVVALLVAVVACAPCVSFILRWLTLWNIRVCVPSFLCDVVPMHAGAQGVVTRANRGGDLQP